MFLSLAFATGRFVSARGQTTLTGQYTCLTQGNYELCNNHWRANRWLKLNAQLKGTTSQLTARVTRPSATLISTPGNDISWSITWTWADNENDVKTYTNVESTTAKGMLLSDISSAPTAWNWEYATKSSGIRADVSYDIWFGITPDGAQASSSSSYEIMIWLSGSNLSALSTSDVSIAGYTWDVWEGPNTNWETISFVSQDDNINDFNVDLNEFFTWLVDNEGVSSSLYLQELLTNSYSVSVTTA